MLDYYVVKEGDSLYSISKDLYGFGPLWRLLYVMNKPLIGEDPNRLLVGSYIKIIRL